LHCDRNRDRSFLRRHCAEGRDRTTAIPATRTTADQYAARVDAVLAQRTRLRGPQPPGDLFAGLPADHSMLTSEPRRPLDPNLERLAASIASDDVVMDVGGGAGRVSLPLALRCREVINVEPSGTMSAGFTANATRAGITTRWAQPGGPFAPPTPPARGSPMSGSSLYL
jgi:hypothetical protein